ncbi:MAG: hypothetical protein JWM99_366 [Verrucomicrobiales bacterium]|nr:hypothetical protein [Verrucomicrobiales bacterium]
MKRIFLLVVLVIIALGPGAFGADSLVTGRVVDVAGSGILRVWIRGFYGNDTVPSTGQWTQEDGAFVLGLTPGHWFLDLGPQAYAHGWINYRLGVSAVEGVDQKITYVVPAATGKIMGTVRDKDGNALPLLKVSAAADVEAVHYDVETKTDADGRFDLPALNGSWRVNLDCAAITARNLVCPDVETIVILDNDQTYNVSLQSRAPALTASGRVVTETGAGIGGVELTAYDALTMAHRSVTANADGSYAVPVFDGPWFVQVSGNLPTDTVSPTVTFTISGASVADIDVKLLNGDATIRGTVKTWTGEPVAGARLWARSFIDQAAYEAPQVMTDASGEFSFKVSSKGAWTLGADCSQLPKIGYLCPDPESAVLTDGTAQVNFEVIPRVTISPTILNPQYVIGAGASFAFTLRGQAGKYSVQATPRVEDFFSGVTEVTIQPGQTSVEVQINATWGKFFRVKGL